MSDQEKMFLESLAQQARRPEKGTTLGRRRLKESGENINPAYDGEHPQNSSGDYWYGKDRKPKIGKGFRQYNPSYEQPEIDEPIGKPSADISPKGMGSFSTSDMKYGAENTPKGDWKGHLNSNKTGKVMAIKKEIARLQAALAELEGESSDKNLSLPKNPVVNAIRQKLFGKTA